MIRLAVGVVCTFVLAVGVFAAWVLLMKALASVVNDTVRPMLQRRLARIALVVVLLAPFAAGSVWGLDL